MKFEQQLDIGIFEPWRKYYISYGKMKRMLSRIKLLTEGSAVNSNSPSNNPSFIGWSQTHQFGARSDTKLDKSSATKQGKAGELTGTRISSITHKNIFSNLGSQAERMPIKGSVSDATPVRVPQYASMHTPVSEVSEVEINASGEIEFTSTHCETPIRSQTRTKYYISEGTGIVTKFTSSTASPQSSHMNQENLEEQGRVVLGNGIVVIKELSAQDLQSAGTKKGNYRCHDDSKDNEPHDEATSSGNVNKNQMSSCIADTISNENEDFFYLILEELDKINNFYIGKLATLRVEISQLNVTDELVLHHASGAHRDFSKLRELYLQVLFLRSYSELCHTGFYKILKKFDKLFSEQPQGQDASEKLKVMPIWMRLVDKQPFTVVSEVTSLMESIQKLLSRDKLLELEQFAIDHANDKFDVVMPSVRIKGLAVSFTLLLVLLNFAKDIVPNDKCASRCAVLLIFIVSMWVTEAIPYFATAMLVLPLTVLLDCFKDPLDPTQPMSRTDAADLVTNSILNHTSMLLLGGFAMSAAISRCGMEMQVASYLQQRLGDNPRMFILATMFFCLFLSLTLANHTAPILASSIVMPIVKDLPSDSRFSKALLLGMAFACNFGGMLTPISSLQNVLAITHLASIGIDISYGRWILVGVPFATVCTLICWHLLMLAFVPDDISSVPVIVYDLADQGWRKGRALLLLSLVCVLLFATSAETQNIFGDIGIIALLFLSVVFGSGMLSEVDFSSLSWSTLMLVGGGNVLGKAIDSSGLLVKIAGTFMHVLPVDHPWFAMLQILFLVLITATFISHTVAAIILLPIICNMGLTLGWPEIVVMGAAMAISAAMAMPFSSFPNVNTLRIKDDGHMSYLTSFDFARVGIPMSFISVFLIGTLGLLLIELVDPGSPSKHHAVLQPVR